jgi:4-hydroxybenzoate polyprenyltransferase
MNIFRYIIHTMRPYLWYRNLLLFAGIVFSYRLGEISVWARVITAFVIFCGISGMAYIFNDIVDKERDGKRQDKRSARPIANGRLSVAGMSILAIIGTLVLVLLSFQLATGFGFMVVAYCILSLLYTVILKHIFIAGEVTKATGFVIRAVAGCVVINQGFSSWLIICTFLLALMLSVAKRNYDDGKTVLTGLTETSAGMAIMAYMLWAVGKEELWVASWKYNILLITVPVVCYAVLRYVYLVNNKREEPEVSAIKDKGILISSGIWAILIGMVALWK